MTEPHPDPSPLPAHFALWGVQFCFGLFPLFGKLAFEAFGPSAVAGWRIAFGSVVLLVLAFAIHGRNALPKSRDLLKICGLGLLGIAGNQYLYLEGLQRSTVVNAGLLMLLIPAYTFLVAVLFRQETWQWRRGTGILIALLGTVFLMNEKGPELTRPYLVGNLLMATNTFLYSLYLVWSKPMMRRYPPLVILAWMYVLCVGTLPFTVWDAEWLPASASLEAWLSLAAILLFPTVLGYLLNLFALARVRASTTAVYIFVQPFISGVAAWVVLGERLASTTWIGGLTIFSGVWLVLHKSVDESARLRLRDG